MIDFLISSLGIGRALAMVFSATLWKLPISLRETVGGGSRTGEQHMQPGAYPMYLRPDARVHSKTPRACTSSGMAFG